MKLWGGRFTEGLQSDAAEYNNSLAFDWRLVNHDILGSLAWAKALARAGVLTEDEASQICAGLSQVLAEVNTDQFDYDPADEDVHTAVERRLTELVGPVGGKLHTGRSRNDQVATDFRLWILAEIDVLLSRIVDTQSALVERAESDLGILMPGYTHLQRAQPVLLSHWWLAHFWPLVRDYERLEQLRARTAVLPLGSGALAGTPVGVDRDWLAAELGFDTISPNSLDAVSDRDFAAEFLFIAALVGVHLSRLSEMLIIFSTAEFGFVELSDDYSTGSSLMPQKKNPDPLELTRGKAGTLIGRLTGLLATLKGLPSAYDKDLQEDKLPVFEGADTLRLMLSVMAGLLRKLSVRPEAMRGALDPALLATDLADYLVQHGVPFREAHGLVGQVVRRAQALGISIDRLPLTEMQSISPVFAGDVQDVFQFQVSVDRRSGPGGTGYNAVKEQLEQAKNRILRITSK
ncbi:MAG: argininosuccinate lyase [Anaerolineaceae bacterium]|nr:argininosuccinate lyase [Anaerolineaceae bacterium]